MKETVNEILPVFDNFFELHIYFLSPQGKMFCCYFSKLFTPLALRKCKKGTAKSLKLFLYQILFFRLKLKFLDFLSNFVLWGI